MEYRKILEEQINILVEINKDLKEIDPEQVRENIETIKDLIVAIETNHL